MFNELKDRCTSLEVRIESLERQHLETVPDTVSDVGNLTDILNAIREENRRIALAANDTEQYGRRQNLRFKGLTLRDNEDCRKVVTKFIASKLQVSIKMDDIEIAHPLPVRQAPSHSQSSSQDQLLSQSLPSSSDGATSNSSRNCNHNPHHYCSLPG